MKLSILSRLRAAVLQPGITDHNKQIVATAPEPQQMPPAIAHVSLLPLTQLNYYADLPPACFVWGFLCFLFMLSSVVLDALIFQPASKVHSSRFSLNPDVKTNQFILLHHEDGDVNGPIRESERLRLTNVSSSPTPFITSFLPVLLSNDRFLIGTSNFILALTPGRFRSPEASPAVLLGRWGADMFLSAH